MTKPKSDLDPDNDNDNGGAITPANDNDGAIAPAPKASALASTALTALVTAFETVDVTSVSGRSIHPLLQFKSREGGIWAYGQRRTTPEPDSRWAVNPASFLWGWVCWGDASKILGETLVPISKPLPDATKLPDKGFPWQQEMAVNLKCISGTDSGTEVIFKTNTEGGKDELLLLIKVVSERLINRNQHGGKVVPIVNLENDSYPHKQHGKTLIPVLNIVDWMSLDGPDDPKPAPAPTPASPSPEPTPQPRRRRVG